MPIVGLRAWASYIMGGVSNPEEARGVDLKFKEARGWRLGAGFHILMLSLNLEYQDINYQSTELEKVGPFAVGTNLTDLSLRNKGFLASVSMPLNL